MSFRPNVHDELTLNGVTYRIAEHPAAPGIPYGQEGRAGIVYQLLPSPTGRGAGGEGAMALKVFRARFRTPALVSQAEKLAAFADLPGLTVCRRTVLTPQRNANLLRREPDLTYAVLMPWIEGPTWTEVMLEKRPLTPQQALDLARAFADILSRMEQNGIAHCDLSGPNVLLPMLAQPTADRRPQTAYRPPSAVELVDVEGLYAPGLPRPEALPSGSSGYAHRTAREGLWGPTADRFAGAVLLAEMLGWGDESVREACYGETYFDPAEMPSVAQASACDRYRTLLSALARHYGQPVADLFERAWTSETLADCPTFGEWLVALPEHPVAQAFSLSTPAAETTAGEQPTSPQESAAVDATAEIRAFMQAARRMEDKGNLEGALALYRQALELAGADPSLRSLAREIELMVQDVQARARPISPRIEEGLGERAISLPVEELRVALPVEEGPRIGEEPRPSKRPWALAGLVFALLAALVLPCLAALVYGVNVQQQQAGRATATVIAWQQQATATAQAQVTAQARQAQATVQAQATANAQAARATATAIAWQQATATAQAQVTAQARATATARVAQATATAIAWEQQATATTQAQATATAQAQATVQAQATANAQAARAMATAIAWQQATATAQAQATATAWAQAGRIAFISKRDGNWEIYVMNADGSGQTNLTNNPAHDWGPSWSPDGRRIAFYSDRDGNWEIYVMNADGSGQTNLTNNPADDWGPSWSPDGRRIAFFSDRDGNREIYVMNADGSGQIQT
jgi:hypothetical protein